MNIAITKQYNLYNVSSLENLAFNEYIIDKDLQKKDSDKEHCSDNEQ